MIDQFEKFWANDAGSKAWIDIAKGCVDSAFQQAYPNAESQTDLTQFKLELINIATSFANKIQHLGKEDFFFGFYLPGHPDEDADSEYLCMHALPVPHFGIDAKQSRLVPADAVVDALQGYSPPGSAHGSNKDPEELDMMFES
jgi:hypothetical protein